MKKRVVTLLIFLFLYGLNPYSGFTQGSPANIEQALRAGNAAEISKYFAPSVDITINNSTATYRKTQAELILKDFFQKNPIKNFETEESGNSNSVNATFTIGNLTTSGGNYKVYIWLKPVTGGYILKALRFDR